MGYYRLDETPPNRLDSRFVPATGGYLSLKLSHNRPARPNITNCHETYLSAKCNQTQARPRIPSPNEDARWSPGSQAPAQKGQKTARGLIASHQPRSGWPGVNMVPRTLERSWQFRICYDRGHKIVCEHTVIFYYRSPGDKHDTVSRIRFGVVASKRVGNAVKRNRAKRLLREATRALANKLNDRHLWIVLIAKSSITSRSAIDVRNDIERGLSAAGLLARDI